METDHNAAAGEGKGRCLARLNGWQRTARVSLNWRYIMIRKHYLSVLATLAIAAGAQWVSIPAYATEQGEQRREARDTRQDGRSTARQTKDDCRKGNDKSNVECRQDKRSTKQDTRRTARDIKY
jgi:hypothetical protein